VGALLCVFQGLDFGVIIFAIFRSVSEKFAKKWKTFKPRNLKTKSGGREVMVLEGPWGKVLRTLKVWCT